MFQFVDLLDKKLLIIATIAVTTGAKMLITVFLHLLSIPLKTAEKTLISAMKLSIDLPDAKSDQNYRIRDERKLLYPRKIISDTFYCILVRLWVWSSIADMTGTVNPSISLTGSARNIFFKAYLVIINYFYIHSPWRGQLFQRVSQVLWEPDIT